LVCVGMKYLAREREEAVAIYGEDVPFAKKNLKSR